MTGTRAAWSVFWAAGGTSGCLPGAPTAVRDRLTQAWTSMTLPHGARVLDIASGSGAIIAALKAARPDLTVGGVDYADVGEAARALGVVGGIDATALPFGDGSFDAVTSQFGIEYCGTAALDESVRILGPGGRLRFVCHHSQSPAVTHNRGRLAALDALRAAGLFELARGMAQGRGENAAQARAIASARAAHRDQSVAEELPLALGRALGGPDALRVRTVAAITAQAEAEIARLSAMIAASLDEAAIRVLRDRLEHAEAEIEFSPIDTADGPIAWMVDGRRR